MTKVELVNEKEPTPVFLVAVTSPGKPKRCVDGRKCTGSELGPQMPGGSLFLVVLDAISNDKPIDGPTIKADFMYLTAKGDTIGVHTGSHKHDGVCDCGFADKLKLILQKAMDSQAEITDRIKTIYNDNKDKLEGLTEDDITSALNSFYGKLADYDIDKVTLTGEQMVEVALECGANVEDVEKDHAELIAFFNTTPNTTFDTNKAAEQAFQAFNLDYWDVAQEAADLGLDEKFTLGASLVLYMATEMVLVEDNGKPALKVEIH